MRKNGLGRLSMYIEFIRKCLKRCLSSEEREIIELLNDNSSTVSMKVVGRGTLTMDLEEARSAMVKDVFCEKSEADVVVN
jgi:hypothetical protein